MTQVEGLVFNEAEHRYLLDGREAPACTHILSDTGCSGETKWFTEQHRDRGTKVHELTEVIDAREWDPASTGKLILNRGYAYQSFLLDTGFVSEMNEVAVCSRLYWVAGKFDKLGRGRDPLKPKYFGKRLLLDVKSGEPGPGAVLQLALYEFMLRESLGIKVDYRIRLHLRDDKQYRVVERNGNHPEDLSVALSAVQLYHWRKNNGLL